MHSIRSGTALIAVLMFLLMTFGFGPATQHSDGIVLGAISASTVSLAATDNHLTALDTSQIAKVSVSDATAITAPVSLIAPTGDRPTYTAVLTGRSTVPVPYERMTLGHTAITSPVHYTPNDAVGLDSLPLLL